MSLERENLSGNSEQSSGTRGDIFERIVSNGKQISVSVDNLAPSPYNTYDVEDVADLKNSIYLHGLITPLTVIGPDEDGKYTILSGERRYHAILEINEGDSGMHISDIPCYVIGGSNMDVVSQRLIIELSNLETREFNRDDHRFQVIRLLKEMSENGTILQQEMVKIASKQLGVSSRYSKMYFTVFNKGSEKVIDAVKKSEMPLHIASNISNLPKEDQNTLLEDTELMDSVKRREISAKDASNIANRPDKEKKLMVDAVKKGADAKKVIETMDVFKEKKKKPIQLDSDQDYEFYQALNDMKENDDYDIDDDDDIESAMDFLTRNSEHIPLNVDTSGLHNELSQEDEEKNAAVAVRKAIRTIKKLKRKTEFTDEEEELFDVMRDVLNYKDSLQ